MFALNEKVVYPGHGVARVSRIIERSIGGKATILYELKFINKDMTVLVPIDNLGSIGVRALSSRAYIQDVFKILTEQKVRESCCEYISSWNKRHKKYQLSLRTGDLAEISKIYRDLQCLARTKELSFGERTLLNQTEILLAEEIAMVENIGAEKVIDQLRALFVHSVRTFKAVPAAPQ